MEKCSVGIVEETPIKVINRIKNTDEELDRVKKGMYATYYGPNGTARTLFDGANFEAAGKTGTAEAETMIPDSSSPTGQKNVKTINLSHVGYAPLDNPEIAFAVIIPHISTNQSRYPTGAANEIVKAAAMKYFELKEKKEQNAEFDDVFKIKKPFNKDDVLEEDEEEELDE